MSLFIARQNALDQKPRFDPFVLMLIIDVQVGVWYGLRSVFVNYLTNQAQLKWVGAKCSESGIVYKIK